MRLPAIVILVASLLLATSRADAAFGRGDKAPKVKTPWAELSRGGKVKRVAWKATKGVGITVGILAATVLIPHSIGMLQGTAETVEHHHLWHLPAAFAAYGGYRVAKWQIKEKLQARRDRKAAAKETAPAAAEGELASATP